LICPELRCPVLAETQASERSDARLTVTCTPEVVKPHGLADVAPLEKLRPIHPRGPEVGTQHFGQAVHALDVPNTNASAGGFSSKTRQRRRPSAPQRYVKPPLGPTKRVLVVDDICTEGFTLEAPRAYVAQTGASTVGLSCLKTINPGYKELAPPPRFDPYTAQTFPSSHTLREYRYAQHVVDAEASGELDAKRARTLRSRAVAP
jgi:hypothetical protein